MFMLSLLSHADEHRSESPMEVCSRIEKLAETVMRKRQDGVSMSTLMKIAGDHKSIQNMVIKAYEETRWGTELNKNKSVENFRNNAFLDCFKELNK